MKMSVPLFSSSLPFLPHSFQRQRLLRESRTPVKTFSSRGIVNGGSVEAQPLEDAEMMDGKKVKVELENNQPEEDDEDGNERFKPFHIPG